MLRRHASALIRQSLREFPAVLLLGARQVGKSTLAMQLVEEGVLERYVTLDDLPVLEAARSDPDGFLASLDGPTALDEFQRVPDLMRALKRNIDATRRPGRFLLTGSANVLSRPEVSESLAGRMDVVPLEGLSFGELLGQKPGSLLGELLEPIDWKLGLRKLRRRGKRQARRALLERIFFGGFPEVALKNNARFHGRWFGSYLTSYVERDIRDLARLPDFVAFGRVVRLVGLRSGNLLNVKNLGADAGIDQRTVARYLDLLEATFQVSRLPPWTASSPKRLVKTPKVFMQDSGFACHLAGIDRVESLGRHPMLGALFETWAWAELRKLLATTTAVQASFYRTHQGREVDFVLERGRQRLGIELKWTDSVTRKDFAGLLDMQEAMAGKSRGLLLYTGDEVVPFSDSLAAAPLWCIL
ncbi:MAG: ATP-binding protein [Planctomycetota bacterium]